MQLHTFFSRRLVTSIACVFSFIFSAAFAASGNSPDGYLSHDALPLSAEHIAKFDIAGFEFTITNSMVSWWVITLFLVIVAQMVSRRVAIIPCKFVSAVEALVEAIFDFFEGIMGYRLAKKYFWFLGGTFILTLLSNYAGLIPGVGTLGWKVFPQGADMSDATFFALDFIPSSVYAGEAPLGDWFTPLFRGANADVNTTLAMAATFFVFWWVISLREVGAKYFFSHLFLPSGVKGGAFWAFLPIFLFVGCLEMVSFVLRPVVLTFRLYGNIFAGETLLETMANMFILAPIPFYFLEILVGFIQALVFTLLCAVFIKLSCEKEAH